MLMKINSARVIFFSPTGTTKTILTAIAQGTEIKKINYTDLTLPSGRKADKIAVKEDLLIIGVPVYEEKVPKILNDILQSLKGDGKPAVAVTVYGDVGDGTALSELKTIVKNAGFIPAAAASFIGEHSFSTKELPIAAGRPNSSDEHNARQFGQMIINKLNSAEDISKIEAVVPDGKLKLMAKILPENSAKMFTEKPDIDKNLCTNCGLCSKLCPAGAIDINTLEIDDNLCLRCFSCVRVCDAEARAITYKKKLLVKKVLGAKSKKDNEIKLYL